MDGEDGHFFTIAAQDGGKRGLADTYTFVLFDADLVEVWRDTGTLATDDFTVSHI